MYRLLPCFGMPTLVIALAVGAAPVRAEPPIAWTPRSLTRSVLLGGSRTVTVSFTSRQELTNVTPRTVPNPRSFIAVAPDKFPLVPAGQPTTLTLTLTAPATLPAGRLQGLLQLRATGRSHRAFPTFLPITVQGVGFLAFVEGDPGSPGDGAVVTGSTVPTDLGPQTQFTFATPVPLATVEEAGFEFDVFLPAGEEVPQVSVQYNFTGVSCTPGLGGAIVNLPDALGTANYNGIAGYADQVSPAAIQGWLTFGGCDAAHFLISSVFIFSDSAVSVPTLDAAALLP